MEKVTREPIVTIYDNGNNGSTAIVTSATTPDEFLSECAAAVELAVVDWEGDVMYRMTYLLPQICDIWAKLKGYKSETVAERRVLCVGEASPERHMRRVTGVDPQIPDHKA